MKRITTLIGMVVLTLALGSSALAGPTWCEQDPIFAVNGHVIDITTGWDGADQLYAQGVLFELQVPSNAVATVVTLPGTVPLEARISYVLPAWDGTGAIPVVANVTVSATKNIQFLTTVTEMNGSLIWSDVGRPNKTQTYAFELAR